MALALKSLFKDKLPFDVSKIQVCAEEDTPPSHLLVHHGGHQELFVRLVWEKEADPQLRHPSCREQKQAEVPV